MPEQNWTKVLTIRPEVIEADGGIGDLQMSLHRAVYQTSKVPYQDVGYYGDITEPTPNLVGFFARVARRLSNSGESVALYHLDQGMGGGKSHALVGLYHMAANPKAFFGTHIGKDVLIEAQSGGKNIAFEHTRIVTLTADHFSPGKATETFGPAVNLFERFLWSLFEGDRRRYDLAVAEGANKSTLEKALTSVDRPVLILLDELMDYAMDLSSEHAIATMPSEQVFLNALMDACDDVPRVAFVLVMIRTELDPEGYTPTAEAFREYLISRINRNGATVAVTETGDFAAIIRRRIFELTNFQNAAQTIAAAYHTAIAQDSAWEQQVLARLGTGKGLATLKDRIAETYPFHPDLMDLVRNEWGKTQGFQRVRSTVAIFAIAALHWSRAANEDGWAPPLIGVGDLPIGGIKNSGTIPQARCLEALLNSGLLLGNDRAIQGYRAVATTDVTSADGASGQAVEIDRKLRAAKIDTGQPHPAVRMATALFNFSLVARSQGKRGASKPELMAALMLPANGSASPFSTVEEVFTVLTGPDGLGALEANRTSSNQPERYWLTINQTLRMFFNSAKNQVLEEEALALVWATAQEQISKGQFDQWHPISQPTGNQTLSEAAGGFDSQDNRLVVLDPRYWALLNGEDSRSREDVRRMFGIGEGALVVDNAASTVVVAVNTYQRRYAVQAAQDVLAWKVVAQQVIEGTERDEVGVELTKAREILKQSVNKAYRHYAYLRRSGDVLEVFFARFDDDRQTSLNGNDVWSALVTAGRAVGEYMDPAEKRRKARDLSAAYLAMLLQSFNRHLTLRDVVSSFYKNPRFPLVPSMDQVRRAIFNLLQSNLLSAETGEWELVGPNGTPLNVSNPSEIAINSAEIQIRPKNVVESAPQPELGQTGETVQSDGEDQRGTIGTVSDGRVHVSGEEMKRDNTPQSYSWYRMEFANRSIIEEQKREAVRGLLLWLTNKLRDEAIDPQLISVKVEFNAATEDELKADFENRASELGAKFSTERET